MTKAIAPALHRLMKHGGADVMELTVSCFGE